MSTMHVRRGRATGTPFAALPAWISLARIEPGAKALYPILLAHVSQRTDEAFPSQQTLADILGRSQPVISRWVSQLVGIGALTRERNRLHGGNTYWVHETPPDGYTGATSFKSYYKADRPARPAKPARPAPAACANPTVTSGRDRTDTAPVDIPPQISGDPLANIHTSASGCDVDALDPDLKNYPPTPGTPGAPKLPQQPQPQSPATSRCRHRRRSCRICGTNPRAQAAEAAAAARAAREATWCGNCDPHTRWRLTDDERPYQCPECHPAVAARGAGTR